MVDLIIPAYLILGIFAGLISGFGLGGGILIVPALLLLFTWQGFPATALMHFAVATSLFTIIFISISASYAHHKHQTILWPQVLLLTPGIIIGAIAGALIADYLSSDILRKFFGLFEILVAYRIAFPDTSSIQRKIPGQKGMLIAGSGIGTLSSILGIGGGTLTIPFLTWCQIDIHKATGSSSACSFLIALAGALVMIITGLDYNDLPKHNIGYVHWPAALAIFVTSALFAPIGVRLANNMSTKTLKFFLATLLACTGLKILF